MKLKKLLKILLRLGLSLGLLAFAYRSVDLGSLLETLSKVSLGGALLLVGLYTLGQVISAVKWRVFLSNIGLVRSYSETLRAYFFGMFVNTFGLGTLGGDMARAVALVPQKGKRAATVATVVADRAHGLAVLLCIGAFAVVFVQPKVFGHFGSPLALLAAVGIACAWLFGPIVLQKLFPEEHRFGPAARIVSLAFPRDTGSFWKATTISVAFHSLQIGMNYIIARELGADISLAYLFAVIPMVNVASSLPLSVNGLGIREAAYALVFLPLGLPQEIAVAFGAIWIVVVTVVSAGGGAVLTPELRRESLQQLSNQDNGKNHPSACVRREETSFKEANS